MTTLEEKVKIQYLITLHDLSDRYATQPSRNFTMNNSIEEMELEYNFHKERISRYNLYNKLMNESKRYNIQLSRKFTIDDSIIDMELEYEHLLQRNTIAGILHGLMIINTKYDLITAVKPQ